MHAPVRERFLSGYSLEITSRDGERLAAAAPAMVPGTAVSVTFLPGDNVESVAAVSAQVKRLGLVPVAHVSARRIESLDTLRRFLGLLAEHDASERVFVVAGDPATPMGPFEDALAIIRSGLLTEYGVRQVGIAGYPDGHPAISAKMLEAAMHDKLGALAAQGIRAEIVTQFAFDADVVTGWLAQIRAQGINVPVRIGLPGPASIKSLLRFAARCGVGASAKVMSKYGVSLTRLLGDAAPDRLADKLAVGTADPAMGQCLIHLYPFGGIERTLQWASTYSARQLQAGRFPRITKERVR